MTPDESFLAAFFGVGNQIPWPTSGSGSGGDSAKVSPWVQRYLAGERPAALPRVRTSNGKHQTTWYIITDNRDASALARAEIQGFLGPSYTDWDPLADLPWHSWEFLKVQPILATSSARALHLLCTLELPLHSSGLPSQITL